MDFYESQDQARRRTKWLVLFFIAAVLCIVVLTNLLVLAVANYSNTYTLSTGEFNYSWELVAVVSCVVVLAIGLGSLYRVISLSGGGSVVAEMMNGQLLVDPGGDSGKRRLLNVVEEMAIASGTPVPPVYVIPDPAINAFAAGYSSGDAVLGITSGAIDNLNRDQLQGVVAHEFSHIQNGDMRLNIRLMGVLYGILMLAVIGRILLRPGARTSRRGEGGGALVALGIGLFLLGYIGRFFGNIIKAAVSRQREFLADASAVQYTRNPAGIAGALKRIGGYDNGSVLSNGEAEEISHAFFGQGVPVIFKTWMATHPPLAERIKRVDPGWDGAYLHETQPSPSEDSVVSGFAPATAARQVLSAIPEGLSAAAHEPYSARAVVYLLLLDRDELIRSRQLGHLKTSADPLVYARLQELIPVLSELTPELRLPLLETAMPALRQLSREQYNRFLKNMQVLIAADNRVGLAEWALQKFVSKHLGEAFDKRRSTPRYNNLQQVEKECALVLSMLAFCDARAGVAAEVAFEAGRSVLDIEISLINKSDLSLTALDKAVDTLADLQPLRKPRLLKACIATVGADGTVAAIERELLRAIADAMDCPLPWLDQPNPEPLRGTKP